MDKLSTFQFNNSKKLFELAKRLHSNKFFETFLNEAHYKVLNFIIHLDNYDIWHNFLEGNCSITITKSKDQSNGEKSASGNDDNAYESPNTNGIEDSSELLFEEGPKMIKMLALHIRYLLWEKAIDYYYNAKKMDDTSDAVQEVSDDFELIDTLDSYSDDDDSTGKAEKKEEEKVQPKIRDEEDDYDDDDDEDEEDEKKETEPVLVSENAEKTESELKFNDEKQLVIEIPISVITASTAANADLQTESQDNTSIAGSAEPQKSSPIPGSTGTATSTDDQEKLIKEFNKVYHNFEYDRETLIKRRRLEKSDMQLEDAKGGHSDSRTSDGIAGLDNSATDSMGISLGSGSTSLKHLLSTIQQKRDDVPLNDHELRSLFMDVRKNRGKWANNDRVGQEELYEACEKVVVELRGYTEHSTPFLNKVSKREAPNYGLIIKKPMDLNTVMKKLKGLSYNSKQEFVDDLMLIWSNCLTYNADPKHFLRAHALAMQKKTAKLIPSIPNITIRSRVDIEKEEELENERVGTPVASAGKSMKKGRKRSRQDQIKTETDPNSPIGTAATSAVGSPLPSKSYSETPGIENGNLSNEEDEEEEEENENINGETNGISEEDDEFDPELQAWRSLTAKSRAHYCSERADLFDEHFHLRSDARAIIRQSREMNNFNQYLSNKEVISKSSNLLENDEPYLLEYDITGGLPGLKYKGVDKDEEERREQQLVDVYLQQVNGDASKLQSSFVLPVDKGLNKMYFENISEIQEIRKICFKISLIRQMQTQQFVHHTQMKQPEIEKLREVDVDAASKLPNHDPYRDEIQFSVLRRTMGKIAMQTGFESTSPFAINTLTQVAEKYMGNLIKTLKLHLESNSSNKLSETEILLLSLLENGVDKPDDLYTFVQERIVKQQAKLKDLRAKLSNFLKELLRPGLENFNERSFEDNSEQFMTGDFSNDLGDDFFGFKELGLDKEFKMLSSSIPIYLLHSRLHNSFSNSGSSSKRNKYEDLENYNPQNLSAADVDKQIGLLIPFYSKLNEKSKTHFIKMQKKKGEPTDLPEDHLLVLIEDEELPQKQRNIRPRLPPTGKIAAVKKKIVANSFFLDDVSDEEDEPSVKNELKKEDTNDIDDFSSLSKVDLELKSPTVTSEG
ncbi:transcription factor, member of the histone acetyltransferase SAGA complex [Scheffersomyces xylosifermentans]|uniref:transcription factor, member of the histone acetyltransferase SAGA complex n=1 Tax=Scheffersomyces xylosifermentans TaxID=1304137 RepID=UPI00315CBB86